MLTKRCPWPADGYEKAICEDDLDLDSGIWAQISDEAKDLIIVLLEKNPAERVALEDTLDHPWFQLRYPGRLKSTLVTEVARVGGIEEMQLEAEDLLGDENDNL